MRYTGFAAALLLSACSFASDSKVQIIGGEIADYQPFIVGLTSEFGSSTFCGGSLLRKNVVVTAAHCVSGQQSKLYVIAGVVKNQPENAVRIPVDAISVHPGYGDLDDNDIALLFLADYDESQLPNRVEPISLAPLSDNAKTYRTFGWGNTTSYGNVFEDDLRQVDVEDIAIDVCKSLSNYESVGANQICAGDLNKGGTDSCQGDSGGPLVSYDAQKKPWLAGVVSWGIGCAQKKNPGVYTRVAKYVDWVEREIEHMESITLPLSATDVGFLAARACYTALHGNEQKSENGKHIEVNRRYIVDGDFTENTVLRGTPINAVTECNKQLADDERSLLVRAVRESNLPFLQASAHGKTWYAPAGVADEVTVKCANSDFWIERKNEMAKGYFTLDDHFYLLGGAVSVNPATDTLISECQVRGDSVRYFSRNNQVIAEVEGLWLGQKRAYLSSKGPIESDLRGIQLTFQTQNGKSGTMRLSNETTTDVFTWVLQCNFPFEFRDLYGTRFEPVKINGEYVFRALFPSHKIGFIAAQTNLEFRFSSEISVLEDRENHSCAFNDVGIQINYRAIR